jgi:hypothetical protein
VASLLFHATAYFDNSIAGECVCGGGGAAGAASGWVLQCVGVRGGKRGSGWVMQCVGPMQMFCDHLLCHHLLCRVAIQPGVSQGMWMGGCATEV